MELKNRAALVTGGGGHIGRMAAETLAELGCQIAVADLPDARPDSVAEAVRATHGVTCIGIACDLADSAAVRAIPDRLSRFDGRLDILINCAALVGSSELDGWAVDFERQGEKAWRKAIDVNLTAPFLLAQALAPQLRASGHGSIINVSSIYGIVAPDWSLYEGTPIGNPAAYAASKGGLLQLTRWLAATLAPDIRVNALTPGGILRDQPKAFVDRYEQRTPLARMGREDDLKGAVAFLASDLSAYMTGQNLVVDGGWTI